VLVTEPAGSFITFFGNTPFGSQVFHHGTGMGTPPTQLLNVDEQGNFEEIPFVPDGVPHYAPIHAWTQDASAALISASTGPSDNIELYWVTYVDKQPVDGVRVNADHGADPLILAATLAVDDSAIFYAVDDDDDALFQLYLVPIEGGVPGAPTQIGELDQAAGSLAAHLDGDKLVYSYDHDQDNVNDRWVRDLDDLQAPAVRVTTQLAGAQTIRTRWSDDYSQLLYWT